MAVQMDSDRLDSPGARGCGSLRTSTRCHAGQGQPGPQSQGGGGSASGVASSTRAAESQDCERLAASLPVCFARVRAQPGLCRQIWALQNQKRRRKSGQLPKKSGGDGQLRKQDLEGKR